MKYPIRLKWWYWYDGYVIDHEQVVKNGADLMMALLEDVPHKGDEGNLLLRVRVVDSTGTKYRLDATALFSTEGADE